MKVSKFDSISWPCKLCDSIQLFLEPVKATGMSNFWTCSHCGEAIPLTDEQISTFFFGDVSEKVQDTIDLTEAQKKLVIELRGFYLECAVSVADRLPALVQGVWNTLDSTTALPGRAAMKDRLALKLRSALASAILEEIP